VRVHHGPATSAIGASVFTLGEGIYFSPDGVASEHDRSTARWLSRPTVIDLRLACRVGSGDDSPVSTTAAVIQHFVQQAGYCDEYGSPFMARLIEALARDIEAGGPATDLFAIWPRSPRADALGIRFAGALHAAALSGRDPELGAEYPATQPAWDMARVWPVARDFLVRERDWVAGSSVRRRRPTRRAGPSPCSLAF